MIGGVDIRIPTGAGESSLIVAARAIRQYWPHAVFENGSTGHRYQSYWDTPLDQLEEVFVYRDLAAADVWDAEGAVPAAINTMIHVIADDGLATIVVDEPQSAAMKTIVAAITSGLQTDILNLFALEAA
jgi:hypothetical protein